MLVSLSGCT